jgi:hypothetical protein
MDHLHGHGIFWERDKCTQITGKVNPFGFSFTAERAENAENKQIKYQEHYAKKCEKYFLFFLSANSAISAVNFLFHRILAASTGAPRKPWEKFFANF